MAKSVLPPIAWDAICGHRNEVRSDLGGFKVNCKTCGANIWCPKRKGSPATTAQRPARSVQRKQSRPPARDESPGTDLERWQRGADAVAKLAGGVTPNDPVVIQGKVLPAGERRAESGAELVEREDRLSVPARFMQMFGRFANAPLAVDPLQPQGHKPCIVCAAEGRRNAEGRWPAATHEAELRGDLGSGNVCGQHLALARRLGLLVRARPLGQAKPPRRGEIRRRADRPARLVPLSAGGATVWVASAWEPQPSGPGNQVQEISGDYTGRLAVSPSSGGPSLRSSRPRRALRA
jgi:hypothetical protein